MAVMWVFRHRLFQLVSGTLRNDRKEVLFTRNLIIAFLPAAVIGALTIKYIKQMFHHPGVFVVTLIVGGLIMLWVERKPRHASRVADAGDSVASRSEEHTSELQSLMRISYAVFCLQKTNTTKNTTEHYHIHFNLNTY